MNAIAQSVFNDLQSSIDEDQLILPTMPEMALKVREISEDEDASIQQLGETISQDTALTARLIKVANSPLFRAPKKIDDFQMALSRLGMQYTCNIATGLAMEQMFQATSDIIDSRMRDIWKKSSEVAGVCHTLCKHVTKLRPDKAALAGLVHKIGVLPILSYAEEHPSLLKDSITLDIVIAELHMSIGQKILATWDFPEEIQAVPQEYTLFSREQEEADYVDIVTAAMLQVYEGSVLTRDVDNTQVQAFKRLGLDPNVESPVAQLLLDQLTQASSLLG